MTYPGGVDPRRVAYDYQVALARDRFFSLSAEAGVTRERVLGEGGMGVVHLVTDRRLGRRAALKLAKPGDAALDARFLREAQVTARLDHPGIPPVHDAGRTSAGELFMLMKFVDGASLESLLKKKPRPPERELVTMLATAADAVAYAHSKGVIHRDLKPANVMVGAFGEVLVMDWGLARITQESAADDARLRSEALGAGEGAMTQAGTVLGTLGYMPPEQAGGEDVDARADVFALGAILCEVLTGAPPVSGPSFANKLSATLQGKIARPRERRPDVPVELDAIAAHALAVDRAERYASASAFGDDLRAWLGGRPVSVHTYGRAAQAGRLVRQHPTLFVGLGVVLAATVVTASVFVVKNRELVRSIGERDAEIVARKEADRGREEALLAKDAAEQAQAALVMAEELLSRGQKAEAIALALGAPTRCRKPEVLRNAGRLLARAHQFDAARRLLEACAAEFPPDYEALLLHAELEQQLGGDRQEWGLREIVEQATARGASNEYLVLAKVRLALRLGDAKTAVVVAEQGVRDFPRSYPVGLARATARFADGRPVWDDLKQLRSEFEVEDAEPYLLRAEMNLRDNDNKLTGALFWVEKACEAEQDNPQTWLRRAELYARLLRTGASVDPTKVHTWVVRALGIHLDLAAAQQLHAGLDCPPRTVDPLQDELCRKSLARYLELYPSGPETDRVREKLARLTR